MDLSKKELMDLRHQETENELIDILNKYHKCMVIRPTGWGKTWLLTKMITMYYKVLYLYPASVIKETVVNRLEAIAHEEMEGDVEEETLETISAMEKYNVDTMTFSKLIRLTDEELEAMNYDCIIMDEAHRVGANKTKKAVFKLMQCHKNTDFIGATATPLRSDGFNVTAVMFNDKTVSPYTLQDAVKDGLLQKLQYYFVTFPDIQNDLEKYMKKSGVQITTAYEEGVVRNSIMKAAELVNMDNVVAKIYDATLKNEDNIKFISFYPTEVQMREKSKEVEKWFVDAIPNKVVESIYISSRTTGSDEAIKEILKQKKNLHNTITLIHCIDMLNQGYHLDDLNGVIMYRSTNSGTIYSQQLGRAWSSSSLKQPIVIDVVDNIHRRAIYEANDKNGERVGLKKDPETIAAKTYRAVAVGYTVSDDGTTTVDENGEIGPFTVSNGHVYDEKNNLTPLSVDEETKQIVIKENDLSWYYHANYITEDDVVKITLHAEGRKATESEIFRKIEAEVAAARARLAWIELLAERCELLNVDVLDAIKWLNENYHVTDEQFRNVVKRTIKERNINIPIDNPEKMLDPNADYPIQVLAKWKKITTEFMMSIMYPEYQVATAN